MRPQIRLLWLGSPSTNPHLHQANPCQTHASTFVSMCLRVKTTRTERIDWESGDSRFLAFGCSVLYFLYHLYPLLFGGSPCQIPIRPTFFHPSSNSGSGPGFGCVPRNTNDVDSTSILFSDRRVWLNHYHDWPRKDQPRDVLA